eukprot:13994784-Ditylum_brightwellii.AAC.1
MGEPQQDRTLQSMPALNRVIHDRTNGWGVLAAAYEKKSNILREQLEYVTADMKEFERLKKICAEKHGNIDADEEDTIEVNAGGVIVTATRGTLTQQKGTIMEALFSGRWDKELQKDDAGRIFLDVNPVCFQDIVNYLREQKFSSEERNLQHPHIKKEYRTLLLESMRVLGVEYPLFVGKMS